MLEQVVAVFVLNLALRGVGEVHEPEQFRFGLFFTPYGAPTPPSCILRCRGLRSPQLVQYSFERTQVTAFASRRLFGGGVAYRGRKNQYALRGHHNS